MKKIFYKYRIIILKTIFIFTFFLAFFITAKISLSYYLIFFDLILLFFLILCNKSKNNNLFKLFRLYTICNIASFICKKLLNNQFTIDIMLYEWFLIGIGACELIYLIYPTKFRSFTSKDIYNSIKKNTYEKNILIDQDINYYEKSNLPDLYHERKKDLKRIKQYVHNVELFGINAQWGMGKSFILEHLKREKDIQKQFEIIQINLLNCDLDNVEIILIEELDKILRRNMIYSRYSPKIKNMLGKNQWIKFLWDALWDSAPDSGLSACLDGFKKELDNLNRNVLVIFEDIDRISNTETIKKVLAISEKLCCNKLHIIYQYDNVSMNNKNFNSDYLEKYIPYSINLTPILYEKLIEEQWKETNISDNFPISIKDVVNIINYTRVYIKKFKLNFDLNINLSHKASPRKIQNFLIDLKIILHSNEKFQQDEIKLIILRIIFIKHFFTEIYNSFSIGDSPLNTLKFQYESVELTYFELLSKYSKEYDNNNIDNINLEILNTLNKIFLNYKNNEVMASLILLGYDLNIEKITGKIDDFLNESLKEKINRENNEKIDCLLWNVLASGTSELTDSEKILQELRDKVFGKTDKEKNKSFNSCMKTNNWNFYMLFKAMILTKPSNEELSQILDIYFNECRHFNELDEIAISPSIINCFCMCFHICNKRNLLKIINFFNNCKVISNFNNEVGYRIFFKRSMELIRIDMNCNTIRMREEELSYKISSHKNQVIRALYDVLKDLEKLKDEIYDFVKPEYDAVISFINKNIELINCTIDYSPRNFISARGGRLTSEESSEFKRLSTLPEDKFIQEAEKSYALENISISDLFDIKKFRSSLH